MGLKSSMFGFDLAKIVIVVRLCLALSFSLSLPKAFIYDDSGSYSCRRRNTWWDTM